MPEGFDKVQQIVKLDAQSTRARERAASRAYRLSHPLAVIAHARVATEVEGRRLPKPRTLKCVDCGREARMYDHRDYRQPLVVEPVCGACNKRRGPGAPYIAIPQDRISR